MFFLSLRSSEKLWNRKNVAKAIKSYAMPLGFSTMLSNLRCHQIWHAQMPWTNLESVFKDRICLCLCLLALHLPRRGHLSELAHFLFRNPIPSKLVFCNYTIVFLVSQQPAKTDSTVIFRARSGTSEASTKSCAVHQSGILRRVHHVSHIPLVHISRKLVGLY